MRAKELKAIMTKLVEKKWEFTGGRKRYLVLIIYDVVDDKRRTKLKRFIQEYAIRVQRSAFEATLTEQQLQTLISKIPLYIDEEDDVRIYKVPSNGYIYYWSNAQNQWDEVIYL